MLQHTLFCTFLSYHYIPTDCHIASSSKGMDSSNTRINLGQLLPGGCVHPLTSSEHTAEHILTG